VSVALSTLSLSRIGREDDYAAPAVFLASPGSQYVTGRNLIVDGGRSVC
jgi:NAD(P)-dependent dehydrogenase (short-subunit alcohol dehydrogenase family)